MMEVKWCCSGRGMEEEEEEGKEVILVMITSTISPP